MPESNVQAIRQVLCIDAELYLSFSLICRFVQSQSSNHCIACVLLLLALPNYSLNVQTVFRASEGASSAMQLFTGQAARLSSTVQDGALRQAQLCSFFTLLGAMPQCLKAEADAILAMIRNAREDTKEKDNTSPRDTEDGTLLRLTCRAPSCGAAFNMHASLMAIDAPPAEETLECPHQASAYRCTGLHFSYVPH